MLTDTTERYGLVSILLHWLAAGLIVYLFLDGNRLEHGEDAAIRAGHIAAGAAATLVLLPRVVWRLLSPPPRPLSANRWLNRLASLVKLALLIDILLVIGAGWAAVWLAGQSVDLLGVLSMPSPLAADRGWQRTLEEAHSLAAHLFIPLTALHVLGALKHVVWDRDRTLLRMLWPVTGR